MLWCGVDSGRGRLASWLVTLSAPCCLWMVHLAGESLFSAVGAAGEKRTPF